MPARLIANPRPVRRSRQVMAAVDEVQRKDSRVVLRPYGSTEPGAM
jgi:hypothetical protein